MQPLKNNKKSELRLHIRHLGILVVSGIVVSFILYILLNKKDQVRSFTFDPAIPVPVVNNTPHYSSVPLCIKLNTVIKKDIQYKIYYTLDGTAPDAYSFVYDQESGILISGTPQKDTFLFSIPSSPRWQQPIGMPFCITVLRAICVDSLGNKGPELKTSYIIDPEHTHAYKIPVVSLMFDPDDFFGYEKGIYVMGKNYEDKNNYIKKKVKFDIPWWRYPANYLSKGADSERPVFIDCIDISSNCISGISGKIRIHGFNTRGFAQKSLRFNVASSQMNDKNCFSIFNDLPSQSNFIFRNGGNDWTKTLIRDGFIHKALKGVDLSVQAYQPVVCFFNGEYWGIHTLRERFDELYIQNKYGINKDSISILELDGRVLYGKRSEVEAYQNLIKFMLNSDLSVTNNYMVVDREIDLVNFADYFIVNMFFVNNDWPHNNCKYWRYEYQGLDSVYRDHKWRYVLYDMDWSMGFNIDKAYAFNMFNYLKNDGAMGQVFINLLKNKEFEKLFKDRVNLLLNKQLNDVTLKNELLACKSEIAPCIDEHIMRWRVIGSKEQWNRNVEELQEFIEKRSAYFVGQMDVFLKQN